jgi:hypothetical protein
MNDKNRVVTNEEADASSESLKAGNVVPAHEFLDSCDILETGIDRADKGVNSTEFKAAELKLLRVVVDHPMRRSSEYPKLAGISPNTLLKIRPGLVERGFIRENKLETSNRGRAAVLLEPLEPARQLVGNSEE